MSNRKPKLDDAPACPDKNCHEAKMTDIVKVGQIWFYGCPKCGRKLSTCYVSETSKAMHNFMQRPKKEVPK